MTTAKEALDKLFLLALPPGTPKPGTEAFTTWAAGDGLYLMRLYHTIDWDLTERLGSKTKRGVKA